MKYLKQNIVSIYGAKGKQWLDSLPEITAKIAKEHNLSGLSPVDNMTFNYVASGSQNDNPIILKIGLDIDGLKREAAVLKSFTNHGAVKVLAEDKGMLLLERALPGTSLREVYDEAIQECYGSQRDFIARDDKMTNIACGVIKVPP